MQWHPAQFFNDYAPPVPFALLILNQPINKNAFRLLKRHACFIICADGGANHYYNNMKSIGLEGTELPNVIVGDLDSIHLDVLRHYESLGVKVVKNPDQYSTDFMKCLSYLAGNCKDILNTVKQQGRGDSGSCFKSEAGDLDVVIFGGLGGRVDQGFAQIHHLYCATPSASEQIIRPNGETYLVSEESISFFLHQGKNTIFTPGGIIPIGGPSLISTQGLEWDVINWKTEFGGRLSTSNHIRAESVEVETSIPVLFTVELAPYLKYLQIIFIMGLPFDGSIGGIIFSLEVAIISQR
ncbi:thiamin pyrophosphokinase 1 [Microsporum canis CBS 113480]|uniref:Thiamine pyrophosphokinase n=1 Tax=Arthroderma otae (strain ATCC MYA-4605 / CBS 113480) TaxID=554155 RepID=C5FPA6_ARTOC|nr:thiamin pyrophosphokinase 1 [Microsporum canis CBS 113480]EEQ31422.1 thiamin pyrophosphokinase 1 [Microsporum canis CBS 113480]